MIDMKKSTYFIITILLLPCYGTMSGQSTVKLFNATGNKDKFSEIYCFDAPTYHSSFDNYTRLFYDGYPHKLHRYETRDVTYLEAVDPFWVPNKSIPTEQKDKITGKLSDLLTQKDSVQIRITLADSLSPILILQLLKEELEAREITTYYPSKGKQPANRVMEISACQCHYNVNSLRVTKNRYNGNYRVEYVVKWKERDTQQNTFPTESETRRHVAYEWERKHKTDMKDIPNLSVSMTKLCYEIAKEKAEQIAAALKKEN